MPHAVFQVALSVESRPGGGAGFVLPCMHEASHRFIVVKDGGGEAIVAVEGPGRALDAIAGEAGCRRLTPREAEELRQSYPAPKLKIRYRCADRTGVDGEPGHAVGPYVLDAAGQPLADTIQTVRCGYVLIDVQVRVND